MKRLTWQESRIPVDRPNRFYEHFDACGKAFQAGDFIVYSSSAGRSAVTKFGIVTELVKARPPENKYGDEVPAKIKAITLDLWPCYGYESDSSRCKDGFVDHFDIQNNGRPVLITQFGKCLIIPEYALEGQIIRKLRALWVEYLKEEKK